MSEPQAHLARECGVAYFACGHHATERYGAPAVAGQVAAQLGLEHEFIEIDNPAWLFFYKQSPYPAQVYINPVQIWMNVIRDTPIAIVAKIIAQYIFLFTAITT
jgi:hypothetical protein